MTREQLLIILGRCPGAVEEHPFREDIAAFKVGGRWFALVWLDRDPGFVNLKCEPEWAGILRDRYAGVRPGYHMNKRHWNTVDLDGSVPDWEWRDMIDHSYGLVVSRLSKAEQAKPPAESPTPSR